VAQHRGESARHPSSEQRPHQSPQEITNPADRERIWNNVVASSKGYANYPKKTSRVIPLGLLRPA
jgi:hypothetical protein